MHKVNNQDHGILYDYYEKTCDLCKASEEKRNRIFIIQFVIIATIFYLLFSPENIDEIESTLFFSNLSLNLKIGIEILGSLLCIVEVYYLIRYIQLNIYIEKIYKNIHETEKQLNMMTNFSSVCREGKNYLDYYPSVQTIIYLLYSYIFPILLLLLFWFFSLTNILTNGVSFTALLNIAMSFVYATLTILYLKFRYTNAKKCSER